MRRGFPTTLTLLLLLLALGPAAQAQVRIKDLTDPEGAHHNHLVGIGLVVGLRGTGNKGVFTQQVAVDMLQRFKIASRTIAELRGDNVFKSGNVSVVVVTADLGPFNRRGNKLDAVVSALDDATSLDGGILMMTPLYGADQVVYAVAQGTVDTNGFAASTSGGAGGGTAASISKNHPTVGRVINGAIVECEARGKIVCNGCIRLLVRNPDNVTSRAIADAVNQHYPRTAIPLDAGSVQVFLPPYYRTREVEFLGDIGLLEVKPGMPARVVINPRTGTIVVGENVRVNMVAVAHGNLAITTVNEPVASQPLPFSRGGKTVVLPRGQVNATEQGGQVHVLERSMTVAELARSLNALGATPRDLIAILEALKDLGALHAEVKVQ